MHKNRYPKYSNSIHIWDRNDDNHIFLNCRFMEMHEYASILIQGRLCCFSYSMIGNYTTYYNPHQRSSLKGLTQNLVMHLNFFHPHSSCVLRLWGRPLSVIVAGNVTHFDFIDNNLYRIIAESLRQKIL